MEIRGYQPADEPAVEQDDTISFGKRLIRD